MVALPIRTAPRSVVPRGAGPSGTTVAWLLRRLCEQARQRRADAILLRGGRDLAKKLLEARVRIHYTDLSVEDLRDAVEAGAPSLARAAKASASPNSRGVMG